jgi:hypothetical protein
VLEPRLKRLEKLLEPQREHIAAVVLGADGQIIQILDANGVRAPKPGMVIADLPPDAPFKIYHGMDPNQI